MMRLESRGCLRMCDTAKSGGRRSALEGGGDADGGEVAAQRGEGEKADEGDEGG